MNLTDYHAKYFAYELTKRSPSDSVETLVGALADAQVDLNPHQIEAALFAFSNPFSRGAILADEVGLGKTIEAGLLLSQRWAESKRKLLIIVPANLRMQWSQELADKFHLPSAILETRTFNEAVRKGNLNPFAQDAIILCSYQFARSREPYIRQVMWDLVVIDEAHRLRNVYKTSSRIALAIKQAVAPFPKLLLTATPLQNSLLELYGLVSIIDDFAFGDLASFRSKFARLGNDSDFAALKERLKPICKRTLRRQVLEYVPYTDRHALVQEFIPSPDEQRLYDLVSEYLQRPTLYALPASQRQLMTLILRKLLASSTYAISGTLDGLAKKLEAASSAAEPVTTAPEGVSENLESFDELAEEWDEDEHDGPAQPHLTPEQLSELRAEKEHLREFQRLAASIERNSKGEVLLAALRRGFQAAAMAQGKDGASRSQQKAVIFTESRRTQDYLFRVLEQTEFKGKVMIFNGVNNDAGSRAIYQAWAARHAGTDRVSGSPTADMRAALVDYFRDEAFILIATEAAAEGINLQFCNMVVNYDLPWNPQRIEQRIGRCHRYGQKFDVVVVNFLNKLNAADQRVYQLLDEKFRLFDGVFGASDEVLGAIESGVDFEKRIASIYQKCRTPQQISFEFDQLQKELEGDITAGQSDAREKLLNNFDQEVIEKVRIQSHDVLDRFNRRLWLMTRHVLAAHADFDDPHYSFMLRDNPFAGEAIHAGPYRIGKNVEDANTYRVSPDHEYILCFARHLDRVRLFGFARKEADFPLVDKRGRYRSTDLTVGMTREMRPNQFYAIHGPRTPTEYWPPDERVWRFEPSTMQKHIASENIIWPEDNLSGRMARPRYKTRYDNGTNDEKANPVSTWITQQRQGDSNSEDIDSLSAGLNQEATKELRSLMGEQLVDYPKPVSLIQAFCAIATRSNDIVLDFFAGSGTTGHSVMTANEQDGGTRKFILVQLPEPTERRDYPSIAEITKERIRRVIANLNARSESELGLADDKKLDRGFRVFKLADSNFETWEADAVSETVKLQEQLSLHVQHVRNKRTESDLLFEILLKDGYSLTAAVEKLSLAERAAFAVANGALIVCLDRALTFDLMRAIADRNPERVVCLDEGFAGNDQLKANAVQTFKTRDIVFRTV